MYDSQSVFRFSLRFILSCHFTSCSYRVYKSCLYRVFSLQEFKLKEARRSWTTPILALISKKSKSRKKRKKRNVGMKLRLKRRKNLRVYETLLAELRLEDEYNYKNYLRMSFENFDEIIQLIKDDIIKKKLKWKTQSYSDYTLQPQLAFYKQGYHIRVMFKNITFSTQQWTVQHFFLCFCLPYSFLSNHCSNFLTSHTNSVKAIKNHMI